MLWMSDEGKHRQTSIEILHTLREQVNVRLFIASRSHPQDIKKAFDSDLHITVEAKESDLKKNLSKEIENSDAVDLIAEPFKIANRGN